MSYPFDAHKDQLPDAETIKERQREEQELAQSLAEEDDDDFGGADLGLPLPRWANEPRYAVAGGPGTRPGRPGQSGLRRVVRECESGTRGG